MAGHPLLDCVPARLSSVASMPPGDVCHDPRCSLAGLRPATLGSRPCCQPRGSDGLPQCARPMEFGCPTCPCVCGVHGPSALVHRCVRMVCSVCSVRAVLSLFAPVHRCAHSLCCVACAVSWATWLQFPVVLALCVVFRVWCPGPLGSCSLVRTLGVLCCVCGVLGHFGTVHWCARSECYVVWVMSWAIRLLWTSVLAQCVVLRVGCPWPLGSCSTVRKLGALCCVCGVLGHFAPLRWCTCLVRCLACAVSLATWLLFAVVLARSSVLRVRCAVPLGPCSPVCPLGVLCCTCGLLDDLDPAQRCACSERCAVCAVSWATWLLFTGVPAPCVVLLVQCPGPLGSCSPLCPLGVLCCECGVMGRLSRFTVVHAGSVALHVRCPGPIGSLLLVFTRGVLCCVSGVPSHVAPVHRCVCAACCFACAVSWATWLLYTGVSA